MISLEELTIDPVGIKGAALVVSIYLLEVALSRVLLRGAAHSASFVPS